MSGDKPGPHKCDCSGIRELIVSTTQGGFSARIIFEPPREELNLIAIEASELAALREDLKCARWALRSAVNYANKAHEAWDTDRNSRTGKMLLALSGNLPGYTAITDFIAKEAAKCELEQLDPNKGGAE